MRVGEAMKKIQEAGGNWETFQHWMRGQTCGVYPDGTANIFDYDVERFIRYRCDPKLEPEEEWD
jgi:hypothetical protein